MRMARFMVGGAALTALSGCATVADRLASDSYLVGPTWQLTSLDGPEGRVDLTAEQSASHSIAFMIDGQVTLQLDCNRGTGDWTASPGMSELRISQIAGTRALCPDPSFGETMSAGLPGTDKYGFSDDKKLLTIWGNDRRFEFRAAD